MKPLKKFFVSIFLLVIFIFLLVLISHSNKGETIETVELDTNSGTVAWLQALCDKDYKTCDSIVASDGFRFTGFDGTSLNPLEIKVYYQFLDYVVDSIRGVEVLNVIEHKDTGYIDYKVEISYVPYEEILEMDFDDSKITSLINSYRDKKISKEELSTKFQEYYFELFKSCFILSSEDNVTSKVLMLSEKEDEDGAVLVYGTRTFIEGLISDEMFENLEVYQSNIKAKVDTVLRQY